MEQKTQKEKTLVRCTDCRIECSGKSISEILDKFKCGRDGGPLRDSCKTTLKSNGKKLFKLVPVESKSKKVDKVFDE